MISVVIPTKNRAQLLQKTLDSLTLCSHQNIEFEVIVVDNNSTDDTETISLLYSRSFDNFRYIKEKVPGLHSGRHAGLLESKGNILAYLDDDAEVEKDWLVGINESFQDDTLMLLGGNNYPNWHTIPPVWLKIMWEDAKQKVGYLGALSIIDSDFSINMNPRLVFGCNFIIRKSALLEIGGFHPDALPEELLVFRGDGETYVSDKIVERDWKVKFDQRVSIYHAVTKERMTAKYFRKRAFSQGVSNSYSDLRKNIKKTFLTSTLNNVKTLTHYFLRFLILVLINPRKSTWKIQLIRIQSFTATQRGYRWHQLQYRNSEKVRRWVHRDNYFDTLEILEG